MILGKNTVSLTDGNHFRQSVLLLHEDIQRRISVIELYFWILYAIKEPGCVQSRRVECREILLNIRRCFPIACRNIPCQRVGVRIIAIHRQAVRFSEGLLAAVALNYISTRVFAICIFATDMVELCDFFRSSTVLISALNG